MFWIGLVSAFSSLLPAEAWSSVAGSDGLIQEPITVRIGRPVTIDSTLLTRVDTHRCRMGVVAVSSAFDWIVGRGGFRTRVAEITVDGRAVAQSGLAEINRVLATFERSPEIGLECHSGQFRLSLSQVERGQPTRVESVPFALDPQ